MKLKSLVAASLILLVAGCSKNDDSFGGLKISRVYAAGQLQVEYSYNEAGLLKNQAVFGFPGRKTSEINCEYDAGRRLLKKTSAFDFSSGPTPVWSYSYTEYSYGPDGRVTEERNFLMQNNVYTLVSKAKPAFDANGRITTRALYLPNDELVRVTTYQYNNAGNVSVQEEIHYNGATPQLEYRYTYDEYDNRRNPHIGLPSAVPPFSVNNNNMRRTTLTNYVGTPGTPVITTNTVVYNTYNADGLPVNVLENGTNFLYEYR